MTDAGAPAGPAPDPRFGVILGFPRSGGTLLRRILDQHPDISCPAEPWLTTACARFLEDTPSENIAIGVRTGLGFAGIPEAEVTRALRDLLYGFHRRMAGGKPVWVEKSGFDLFHLPALSDLLAGHAGFICMLRHPLDTIASNLDLAARMGRFMPEMQPYLARFAAPVEALAAAWTDRTTAMLAFARSQGQAAVVYKFEDLITDPHTTLTPIYRLLGVAAQSQDQIAAAIAAPARPGLGDWKTHAEVQLTQGPVGRWQKAISRRTAAGLMAGLQPLMTELGYDPVRVPRTPSRDEAIKQFGAALRLAAAKPAEGKP